MSAHGVLYIATRSDDSVEHAFLSAESVRRHAPDLPITLLTDRPTHPLCGLGTFAAVIETTPETDGTLSTLAADGLARTPYARTIALAPTMRALSPAVAQLFARLDATDVILNAEADDTDISLVCYQLNTQVKTWLAACGQASQQAKLLPPPSTLRLAHLESSWIYHGDAPAPPGTPMQRMPDNRVARHAELLALAFQRAKAGHSEIAQRIYDYVGTCRPLHQLRAYWPLALTTSAAGAVGEEWASSVLKQVDLHILYNQAREAAGLLSQVSTPTHRPQVLVAQARLALDRGAINEAYQLIEQARALAPRSSYVAVIRGAILSAGGAAAEAIPALTAASQDRPGAHFLLGLAFQKLGKPRDAALAYKKAYAFDPDDFGPANNLLTALLEDRKWKAAADHADALLARKPGHTTSLAFKYIALGELGHMRDVATLADYNVLLQDERLDVPPGYADLNAFHHALAQEIAAEPTLSYERNTTRLGHQTDDISFSSSPAIQQLNAMLFAAVQRRADAARANPHHPFDAAAPLQFRLYSWGVIIREKGHQDPHFHPHGWLSGVYYIEVPDEITETDPAHNGWIEFGRGDPRWNLKTTTMPTKLVRPEAGVLLTFPSYFWHSTRPLKPNKARISFAFDVIPL